MAVVAMDNVYDLYHLVNIYLVNIISLCYVISSSTVGRHTKCFRTSSNEFLTSDHSKLRDPITVGFEM